MAEAAKKVSGNAAEGEAHTLVLGSGFPNWKEIGGILTEIAKERRRQIDKGYDADHDDSHASSSLVHNGYERFRMLGSDPTDALRRKALIQLGAIVVAEIERHDRAVGAETFSVE